MVCSDSPPPCTHKWLCMSKCTVCFKEVYAHCLGVDGFKYLSTCAMRTQSTSTSTAKLGVVYGKHFLLTEWGGLEEISRQVEDDSSAFLCVRHFSLIMPGCCWCIVPGDRTTVTWWSRVIRGVCVSARLQNHTPALHTAHALFHSRGRANSINHLSYDRAL